MSEQTKNKPNTAEIVVSIICALILIVTLGLFARNVINAAREDESRRQSEADESLYRHDTADAEQLRLREAFAAGVVGLHAVELVEKIIELLPVLYFFGRV